MEGAEESSGYRQLYCIIEKTSQTISLTRTAWEGVYDVY
jgi:hypothetical protein